MSQTDVVLWHWNTEIGSIRLWLWLMPLRLCLISTHCCLAPCFFFLPLPDFWYLCFYPQEETKTSWTLIPTAETLWNKEMWSEHAHLSSSLLFKAIISTWMITSKDTILYLNYFLHSRALLYDAYILPTWQSEKQSICALKCTWT